MKFIVAIVVLSSACSVEGDVADDELSTQLTVAKFHRDCPPGQMLDNTYSVCGDMEQTLAETGKVYWVSQTDPNASDDGTGQRTRPWKSISPHLAQLAPGDSMIVRTGTYHESVEPPINGVAGKPITFAAYTGDHVVITGADVVGGWTSAGSGHPFGVWQLPFDGKALGLEPGADPQGYMGCANLRRELVIFDDRHLRPVGDLSQLVPGTFYVATDNSTTCKDRDNSAGDNTTIHPSGYATAIYAMFPDAQPPSGHDVQVATRKITFGNSKGHARSYLRVLGFDLRYAADTYLDGTRICGDSCLVEENYAHGNGCTGMGMATGTVFRGNITNDNGDQGFGGTISNGTIEFHESRFNDWKSYSIAVGCWGGGAGKISESTNAMIRWSNLSDNFCNGMWFDVHNDGVTLEYSKMQNNVQSGIQIEMSSNVTILNNLVTGTTPLTLHGTTSGGYGVLVAADDHVDIVNNTIIDNASDGILVRDDARWLVGSGFNPPCTTGDCNGDDTIANNLVARNAGSEIHLWLANLALDGNVYWRGRSQSSTFDLTCASTDPTICPDDISDYLGDSQPAWHSHVHGDADSVVEDPRLTDGWHILTDSPARGLGRSLGALPALDLDHEGRPTSRVDSGADQYH